MNELLTLYATQSHEAASTAFAVRLVVFLFAAPFAAICLTFNICALLTKAELEAFNAATGSLALFAAMEMAGVSTWTPYWLVVALAVIPDLLWTIPLVLGTRSYGRLGMISGYSWLCVLLIRVSPMRPLRGVSYLAIRLCVGIRRRFIT